MKYYFFSFIGAVLVFLAGLLLGIAGCFKYSLIIPSEDIVGQLLLKYKEQLFPIQVVVFLVGISFLMKVTSKNTP